MMSLVGIQLSTRFMEQIALALRYGEQDLLGSVASAVGSAQQHIGHLVHHTERRGLVLVTPFLDRYHGVTLSW